MSERTGFIMHFENCKYFSRLNDEQLGVLFRAVCAYAADGTEQDSAPHAKQELYIRLSEEAEVNDILRCPAK